MKENLVRLGVGVVTLIIALASPLAGLIDGALADTALSTRGPLVVFIVPYLIIGWPVIRSAFTHLAHGDALDENFLMVVATVGALALGHYPEAVGVMLFFEIGDMFEDIALDRSRRSISAMMDIVPEVAHLRRDGKVRDVAPKSVHPSDELIVYVGERVPLDGIVVEGSSRLDTSALTGESLPRRVEEGDDIFSGSVNLSDVVVMRVVKEYGESTASRILELVEGASERKARSERFITRFARIYTPIVCALAVVLAVIPPLVFGADWADWIERGLIFLMVSCPCALVISVPLTFFGGIGAASREGVLVKGGNYLETLGSLDTAVFDKTGTLTRGVFEVIAVHPSMVDEDTLLDYAACAEAYSNHPIALSIRHARAADVELSRLGAVRETAGKGVSASVDGHEVLVGCGRLMEEQGIEVRDCKLCGTTVHVAVDGVYAGHIIIADVVKPDAQTTIADLHELGVSRTVMLSGDHADVAEEIASKVGVDECYADLLPADKLSIVERLLADEPEGGRLAFIGDGINDAPTLARCDVGIAMGALGADAAIEAADVVLMDDDPAKIPTAVRIARATVRIARENIVFALAVKFAILILAVVGLANMWMAVFADVGVTILAVLNAMRMLRWKDGHRDVSSL